MSTDRATTFLRIRPARKPAARRNASRFSQSLEADRTSERIVEDGTLLPATVVSILITTTIWLTMQSSAGAALTLALHYPLFLLIALVAAHSVPRRWRTLSSLLTIPFVLLELVLVCA